ncbi:MAG: hypothetical protein IJD70_07025 [Clostridia bacterium]|nr:hypothetical protein [Clostridia bacterium]
MKTRLSIIALMLIFAMILPSCSRGKTEETTEAAVPDTTPELTEPITDEMTTSEPEIDIRLLQKPYIDVEFSEDGGFFDAMEHVDCTLDDEKKGSVVCESVTINGKEYKIPHLYVKQKGGVGRLTYNEINEKQELYDLLADGFTMEAFLVNGNSFNSSSDEQCLTSSTQSGGYNLTVYKGKYTFSVHTGGSYRNPALEVAPDGINMLHLIGVYDPDLKTAALYVNGEKVSEVQADGIFALASGSGWTNIILGGDTTADCGTHILSSNTRIADYKLYPSAMNDSQIKTVYELMLQKFTGLELGYEVMYYENEESYLGMRLFPTIAESYADVYEPKTAIVNSPTVITYANKTNYKLTGTESPRPATIVFKVKVKDGVLYAFSEKGDELAPLYDAVEYLRAKIIPGFAVEDMKTAELLIEFINHHRIGDCFVIASEGEILKKLRSSTRSARPVLDLSGASDIDLSKVKLSVSAALAKGVIIDSSILSAEDVTALRAYALSVFLMTEDSVSAIHDAVFKGAMGIICPDADRAIGYLESFKKNTLCFPTMIVAHRGDMQNCPENTLPSFISAARSGADVIELDVYLTKDGYLAINHDATTSKWNEKLTVTESTRAELKALKNAEADATADDEFAFYEEVVDYFSKNYTDVVFTVEIKDKRNEVIDKVVEVTKAAGMLDRILIICTNHSIIRYAYQTYGVAVQMNRSYIQDANDLRATLAYACEEVTGLNSSYFTVWKDCIYDLNKALRHRGIKYSPWTTTTEEATDSDFALGYPEFTTNTPHRVDSYARYLRAEISAGGEIKVYRVNYDGSEQPVTTQVKLIVLEGDVSLKGDKVSGSGRFAFSYSAKIGDYTYEICSVSLATTQK